MKKNVPKNSTKIGIYLNKRDYLRIMGCRKLIEPLIYYLKRVYM